MKAQEPGEGGGGGGWGEEDAVKRKAQEEALMKAIKKREGRLKPVYQQLAVSFAALHDTPQRMKARGRDPGRRAVGIQPRVFSLRLRRRVAQSGLRPQVRPRQRHVSASQPRHGPTRPAGRGPTADTAGGPIDQWGVS